MDMYVLFCLKIYNSEIIYISENIKQNIKQKDQIKCKLTI